MLIKKTTAFTGTTKKTPPPDLAVRTKGGAGAGKEVSS